jgi:hypothetical protein
MIGQKNSTIITSLVKNKFRHQKNKKDWKKDKKKRKKDKKKRKKDKKKRKKDKKKLKDNFFVNDNNIDFFVKYKSLAMLLKNIEINYPFYIVSLCCLYFLSLKTKKDYFITVLSFIFISGFGYFVHWCSHAIPWTELYSQQDNFFSQNIYSDQIIRCFLNFMEFHDVIHHDSSINKQFHNIFLEAVNNSVTQGLLFVFVAIIIKQVDLWACVLWALLYATFHNINYNFLGFHSSKISLAHRNHHIDPTINFGIDIWDIIFNTKYPDEEPENYNHYGINLILLTIIMCYFMPKKSLLH